MNSTLPVPIASAGRSGDYRLPITDYRLEMSSGWDINVWRICGELEACEVISSLCVAGYFRLAEFIIFVISIKQYGNTHNTLYNQGRIKKREL